MGYPVLLLTSASAFISAADWPASEDGGSALHIVLRPGWSWMNAPKARHQLYPAQVRALFARCSANALVHSAWGVTQGMYRSVRSNLDRFALRVGLLRAILFPGRKQTAGANICAYAAWTCYECRESATRSTLQTAYGGSNLTRCGPAKSPRITRPREQVGLLPKFPIEASVAPTAAAFRTIRGMLS